MVDGRQGQSLVSGGDIKTPLLLIFEHFKFASLYGLLEYYSFSNFAFAPNLKIVKLQYADT